MSRRGGSLGRKMVTKSTTRPTLKSISEEEIVDLEKSEKTGDESSDVHDTDSVNSEENKPKRATQCKGFSNFGQDTSTEAAHHVPARGFLQASGQRKADGSSNLNNNSTESKKAPVDFNKFAAKTTDVSMGNARNTGPRKPMEYRPHGHIPKGRELDAIHEEDKKSKDLYANAFDADEEVKVTGLRCAPLCIDKWTDISLHPIVLKNIENCGYIRPRKIQSYTIPLIFEGHDVKAQAETGSGKSGSYLIPIISMIAEENDKTERLNKEKHLPRAIVVAPTRELVMQLSEQAMKIASRAKVKVKFCYGEYDVRINSEDILSGVDLLVATPGRLAHFMNSSIVGIGRLKYFVLDEADLLLGESFEDSFKEITSLRGFPSRDKLQIMMFSATYPGKSASWIDSILKPRHVTIKNDRANEPNSRIVQTFEECSANDKTLRLLDYCQNLITKYQKAKGSNKEFPRILAFVKRCDTADSYAFYLNDNGVNTLSLNSKRGQKSRENSLDLFRRNEVTVIVATDVCSRGLDIKDLDYVINVDLPEEFSTYVQRIGRTGRLQNGFAHSFVDMANDQEIILELVQSLKAEGQIVPKFLSEVH